MRDDIQTSTDLARIIREEIPDNVIVTPTGGTYQQSARTEVLMHFQTASLAAKAISPPGSIIDAELLLQNHNLERVSRAAQRAQQASRFRQTTKISKLSENP